MAKRSTKTNGYAFFDLDFTLLPYDTMLLFGNFILKKYPRRIYYLFLLIPAALLYLLKIIRTSTMKRVFFSFLWKFTEEDINKLSREFVSEEVIPRIHPELLNEIRNHNQQGSTTILNTASPGFYSDIIGEMLGFNHVISTNLVVTNPMKLLPPMEGSNNKGAAKIMHMIHLLPSETEQYINDVNIDINHNTPVGELAVIRIRNSHTYSDSIADLPMLMLAENPVLVDPKDSKLSGIASVRGWKTILPACRRKNFWKEFWMITRQILGVYR